MNELIKVIIIWGFGSNGIKIEPRGTIETVEWTFKPGLPRGLAIQIAYLSTN